MCINSYEIFSYYEQNKASQIDYGGLDTSVHIQIMTQSKRALTKDVVKNVLIIIFIFYALSGKREERICQKIMVRTTVRKEDCISQSPVSINA